MAYLSLKFRDVYIESKEVMDDNIAKKCSKSLVIPTGKTTDLRPPIINYLFPVLVRPWNPCGRAVIIII